MKNNNWESFISKRIPEILKENEFGYGRYAVSYSSKLSEFLKTYLVSRGKKSLDKILKVDVKIRNTQPSSKELGEIILEDVPVAKLPIVTDSGVVIKGTKYFYVNEIKQSDGWYVLSSLEEKEDILESVASEDEYDMQLDIPTFDSDFESNSDEFTDDELDGSIETKEKLYDLIKNSEEENKVSEEDLDTTNYFSEGEENYELSKEDKNKYTTYLQYRGPFARNLLFSIKKNKDGTKTFKVQYQSNKRKRTVSWFTFLKAILPNLSAEEIVEKFKDLPIINEAYVSALHNHAVKASSSKMKEPSIEASSEECALYCLSEFFVTKKGNKFLNGIENPVGEFMSRINSIRCNTANRNENIFSYCNLKGYILREELANCGLSREELIKINSKIKLPSIGDSLSLEQLIVLDSLDSLKFLKVSKTANSKAFCVEKPEVRDNFCDEIIDMFKHYLLVCEGIGSAFKMDNFKNKEIDTIESKLESMLSRTLFEFRESFCDIISTRDQSNSRLSENEFSKCFVKDISKGYKDLLRSIHESSNYQGKDDTNSLAEYSQSMQLKYAVKNAPLSLRSLAEDQYGFICPQTTSEGGNVGLNIFRTTDTVIENNILKKKFYVLDNGKIVMDNGNPKIVALSAGEVERNFVIKFTKDLNFDINREMDCYCGSRKTRARLRNIGYMELSDGQNVSPNLAIIVGANNNGGKRGTMGPNQEKQSQPLLIPKRCMVDTGVFEHEDIGVIRAEKFIKKALIEIGQIKYIDNINDDWSITLNKSTQEDYASRIEFNVWPPSSVINDNPKMESLCKKLFYYDIATLAPTVKRSLRHFIPVIKENNNYLASDIVARASDVNVENYKSSGEGYLGTSESNFGPAGGTQLRVAFGIYKGFGYEDAIILNEDSVLSGKLATMTFFNIVDEIKLTGDDMDSEFGKTSNDTLSYIQNNGLPAKGVTLGVGDVVISRLNKIVQHGNIEIVPSYTRLKEGSKDKGCVVSSSIETYQKEDGFKYLRATVSLMYISNPALGTKFSGGHGNKGVASLIIPACMMPYDEEGNRADIILNSTGSLPRNNLGQFTEIIKNTIGIKTNTVQLIKPFEKWDIPAVLEDARLNGVVPKKMYDGVTGQPYDRDILVGYMTIFRSEHDVKGKFNSCSLDGNVNNNTLTVARGPGGGQRVGEMTTWALMAKGSTKYLDSLFTVQGGDVKKKEVYKNALKNNTENLVDTLNGDNRLNILAKVRYFMMGCIFEDYNKGAFKPLNDEVINLSDSPFIVSSKYDIENASVYGEENNKLNSKAIAEFQSFSHARCVDMHKRIIYPMYIESSFLMNNMYYMTSTTKEDNCFYSAVSSLMSNEWEKPSYCNIEDIKHLSDTTSKSILNKAKFVVWVKGMRLPIVIKSVDYYELEKSFSNKQDFSKKKYEESVKVFKGYDAILSLLLGYNFDPNDNVNNDKCKKNGSVFEPLILGKLLNAINGKETDKFGVTSYNFGDFFKDLVNFSTMLGYDQNELYKLNELFEKIDKKELEIQNKIQAELSKPKEERKSVTSMQNILIDFICRNESESFPEFSNLDYICPIQRHDLYKEVSCKYFWVPPRVFRGDNIGGNPSDLKKMISSLVKDFSEFSESHSNTQYTTEIYKKLQNLSLYCINELKNHKNKNAILRDQVMSVRVNCSARGYITVDPTLGMDEVGLPLPHAAGTFDTFLHQIDGYPSGSTLYNLLKHFEEDESTSVEVALKHKKLKSELFTFLSSDNRESFKNCLKPYEVYKHYVNVCKGKLGSVEEAENFVFDSCKEDLIKRLEDLLEIHPVTLERAPTFWANSVQAFKGILKFNCHSIALCPLVCKAFNADFDGDQMSSTIAIEDEAINDQKKLMFPSSNLINISDGKLIQNLNQDMALGIYWLTIERENKLSASIIDNVEDESKYVIREKEMPIASYSEIELLKNDIEMGVLKPHSYIVFRAKVNGKVKFYKDTAGRILFNGLIPECDSNSVYSGFTDLRRVVSNGELILVKDTDTLEEGMEFLDEYCVLYTDTVNLKCIRNKDLQSIGNIIAHTRSKEVAKDYLETIMRLGFGMAHLSGVSLSLFDFEEIITDMGIKDNLNSLKDEVEKAKKMLELGFATEEEYSAYLVSRFNKADTHFADYLKDNLSRYSNLYLLIDSGARGSFKQLVSQSIMVGLPTDAKGNVIPEPIFGNYAEGLNSTEYFNTSYVAREALVTGSMYTGNIGEILRTMVYQCEHNVIMDDYNGEEFCDADSVPVPLSYDVKLPSNLDVDLVEFVPNGDSNWNSLIEDWESICSRTSNFSSMNLFKELLAKNRVTEFTYRIKGSNENINATAEYKLNEYCRNMIIERSLDMNKWAYGSKCFSAGSYYVVNNETIKVLEREVLPNLNIYLAMNCNHKRGICRRCYGVTDLWQVPKRFSNVGIQSAQSIGQVSSQLALDSHKSSGGSPLSNFSSFVKILRQQGLGSQVLVADRSGVVDYSFNAGKTQARIRVIGTDGVQELGTYKIASDTSFLKYNNGDYVNAGDILYYNKTLNYSTMLSYMSSIDLGELGHDYKCKLNILKEIVDLYNCDLSIRHFDILLRDLTRFGVADTTKIVNGEIFVEGGVYQASDLKDNGIKYTPVIVSSLKSLQLNGKHASSMAMSYLRKQIGNASILKKESMPSPLNCLLEGICLEDVYGEYPLTEEELAEKYASRRYGENINTREETILNKYKNLKSTAVTKQMSLGRITNKSKVRKNKFLNFDELPEEKLEEQAIEPVKNEEVIVDDTENKDVVEKVRVRDRIVLHNRPTDSKSTNSDNLDEIKDITQEKYTLNANKTSLFK